MTHGGPRRLCSEARSAAIARAEAGLVVRWAAPARRRRSRQTRISVSRSSSDSRNCQQMNSRGSAEHRPAPQSSCAVEHAALALEIELARRREGGRSDGKDAPQIRIARDRDPPTKPVLEAAVGYGSSSRNGPRCNQRFTDRHPHVEGGNGRPTIDYADRIEGTRPSAHRREKLTARAAAYRRTRNDVRGQVAGPPACPVSWTTSVPSLQQLDRPRSAEQVRAPVAPGMAHGAQRSKSASFSKRSQHGNRVTRSRRELARDELGRGGAHRSQQRHEVVEHMDA